MRRSLLNVLQSPSLALVIVFLVTLEAFVVFLLLMLEISIQESFRTLDCWNSTASETLFRLEIEETASTIKEPVQITSTILITLFFIEATLRLMLLGKGIRENFGVILDAVVATTCFGLSLAVLINFSIEKQVAQFIILLRLWRLLELFGLTKKTRDYLDNADRLESQASAPAAGNNRFDHFVGHEQSVTTLMLKIEELEAELAKIKTDNSSSPKGRDERASKQVCQRCINHNWTTDDLLKMACVQLSRSESKFRDDFRVAKSLDDLSSPDNESGYSTTAKRIDNGYPPIYFPAEPFSKCAGRGIRRHKFSTDWMTELLEIQRVSRIAFPPNSDSADIPVTSL